MLSGCVYSVERVARVEAQHYLWLQLVSAQIVVNSYGLWQIADVCEDVSCRLLSLENSSDVTGLWTAPMHGYMCVIPKI
jgi:hypothetical protein